MSQKLIKKNLIKKAWSRKKHYFWTSKR
jgi:hypothetical protein